MTCALAGPEIVSAEHKRDPFSFYARLRAEAPVARVAVPRLGDAWFLTTQEHVIACLTDARHFVRDPRNAIAEAATPLSTLLGPPNPEIGPNMLNLDGAAHRRLRLSLAKWFNRQAIERWREPAERTVHRLLDRMAGRSEVDLIADYAQPFTLAVTCAVIGISDNPDDADGYDFKQQFWSRDLYTARRARPRDDLATALACGTDDRAALDEREFVAMMDFLHFASRETTANLIGSGVLALLDSAVAIDRLLADRRVMDHAIEELLRFCAPVETALPRFVAKDIVLGGECLQRGDFVFPILASANRDETQFAAPDRLDIYRHPNPHLAFGAGPHYCIGLHLARMEAEIALTALFQRFPRLALAKPSAALAWRPVNILRGLEALPVRLN
jgi:cytochrome P450